ncbi:MAG TPA: ATP-binding protein [Solirubrobacteraceae bacterium]|jgi:anti-sigma regulatory factor (Ser/Thr protein kinase)
MSTKRFAGEPTGVSAARRFVREQLVGRDTELVEAAELLTSELASNCVRHAGSDFEVAVRSRDPVRIEVRDHGGGKPTVLSPTPEEPTGRGLAIVEAMSDRWGVIPTARGKTVWFALGETAATRGR